jgi:hypothetical protein
VRVSSSHDTLKVDYLPPAVRKHPELARLLRYAERNPELQAVLMEFFRACELLTQEQRARVFAYGVRFLKEHYPSLF